MSNKIVVNSKIAKSDLTGVQRYLGELLSYFEGDVTSVAPSRVKGGMFGHLWEQGRLPFAVGDSLLWSPSNSGPLLVKKQVLTIHDMVPLDHPEWLTPAFCAWYKFLLPRLIPRVRKVIAVSEFTRSRILALTSVHPENVVVIHNGVDPRFSPRPLDERANVREELKLPSPRYMLSVGSIEPRKNLKRLLEAWSEAQSRLASDLWLVLTGKIGKKRVFQEADIGTLPPRVYFTGHVPDRLLPGLYSGADAFLYLSVYEGFGIPPLEAMSCGVPTMTGNLTALPEVVGNGGALMVNPFSVEEIAEGIVRISSDNVLRDSLRRAGIERANQFSWEKAAMRTRDVLLEQARE